MTFLNSTIFARRFTYSFMFLLFFISCKKETVPYNPPYVPVYNNPSMPVDTSARLYSYLALGDSYTIGQSVTEDQRFPNQATRQLISKVVKMAPATIIATTGWTTGNLLTDLTNHPPSKTYDFVTLLIGVNNQYQGRSTSEYRLQFTELLNRAVLYAGGLKKRVFVLSIPDYSVTRFAQYSDTVRIAREIDEFNTINKEISLESAVTYLDITGISRQSRTDPALVAPDGLHPSGKQYEIWSSLLSPLMKAAL